MPQVPLRRADIERMKASLLGVAKSVINLAANYVWTGDHKFEGDIETRHIFPETDLTYDAGKSDKRYRVVYAAKLSAAVLSPNEGVILGEKLIIAKAQGTLGGDVSSIATTVDFGQALTPGDWIAIQTNDVNGTPSLEWMLVGSLDSSTTYNVTRNVDGSGANAWALGTPYMVIGAEGDFRIEMEAGGSAHISLIEQSASWNTNTKTVRLDSDGITAVKGTIGGWEIVTNFLRKLSGSVGITLDASSRAIKVGDTSGNHIQIDGANERICSSNFVDGRSGFNISAATGDAEFNNLVARGEMRTFLLTAENQMAVGGKVVISKDSGKLGASASSADTTVDFGKIMTPGDWVKMHGQDSDGNHSLEWLLVGSLSSGTTYNVTRNVDGSGANNWDKDTPFVVIGQEGDFRIEMEAGDDVKINMIEQGDEWDKMVEKVVLDKEGVHTSADLVDINWFLPLNLASDDVSDINKFLYDGSEYIYAFGNFKRIGGVEARSVARYSRITRNWETVGNGFGGSNVFIYDAAFDGSGDLYIVGSFENAGGDAGADNVAKLVAGNWVNVGGGVNEIVYAIAFDGSGVPHIGGVFTNAGGDASANYIAKLVSGSWANVGGGVNLTVRDIAFNSAGVLHIVGLFDNAGGDPDADNVAKLVAGSWEKVSNSGFGSGFPYKIIFDDADVPYICGNFQNAGGDPDADRVAKLVAGNWTNVGGGVNSNVNSIAIGTDGTLYIGGTFSAAGGDPNADRFAMLKDDNWVGLSKGGGIGTGSVGAILPMENGSVIVGGTFEDAGAIQCQGIALFCRRLNEAVDTISSLFELYSKRLEPRVGKRRLSLEFGVPVPTSNKTGIVVYWTDGNTSPFVNTPTTTNTPFDVFVDGNNTLSVESWASDSARAVALRVNYDGALVSSADPKKLYLGTCRTTGTTRECEDSTTKRFVWNYYNRVERRIQVTGTSSHTNTNTAVSNWDGDATLRGEWVCGVVEDDFTASLLSDMTCAATSSTTQGCVGLGFNTTAALAAIIYWQSAFRGRSTSMSVNQPVLGHNYLQLLERGLTGVTFYVAQLNMAVKA